MNLADLSMLLTAVIGPVSGFSAAHVHKAGVPASVLFALGGLGVGVSLGMMANNWAYRISDSKGLHGALAFFAYVTIPFLGILAVAVVPFWVAEIVYGHT